MAQKLLGLSGTKQSGKTTCMNYLYGVFMQKNNVISADEEHNRFAISTDGKLLIPTPYTDAAGVNQIGMGEINWEDDSYEFSQYCDDRIFPHIKEISFAVPLKELCINLLGLTREQCYGTDEQKNSLTTLRWEDMPGNVTIGEDDEGFAVIVPDKTGFMTAREVLQYVGTNIFRKMYSEVWTRAGIKQFIECGSDMGVFTDIRFPNELDAVYEAGGKIIRLLRRPHIDLHKSETALDDTPHDRFSAVIDNRNMSIPEQNEVIHNLLLEWGWV